MTDYEIEITDIAAPEEDLAPKTYTSVVVIEPIRTLINSIASTNDDGQPAEYTTLVNVTFGLKKAGDIIDQVVRTATVNEYSETIAEEDVDENKVNDTVNALLELVKSEYL